MTKTKRHRKPSEELPVLYLRMPVALGRDLKRAAAVLSKLAGKPVTLTGAAITILTAGARDLLSADLSKASKLAPAAPPRKRKLASTEVKSKLATIPEVAP